MLKPYRGWPDAEEGSRLARWLEALEGDVDVRATTSGDELYLDSYERYAGESLLRIFLFSTVREAGGCCELCGLKDADCLVV